MKMSSGRPRSVWIRSLVGDFPDRRSVTLLQGFCCCCCCCVQVPVNAACGVASGLLLPAVGPLCSTRPLPWPLRLRLAGAGLVVGAAHGLTALLMWTTWPQSLVVYVGSGALLAIGGGVLVALALRADRWHRATLGVVPRCGRSLALGAALGFALGSMLVSAVHAYDQDSPQLSVVSVSVGVSAVLGLLVGWWLVARDEGSVPWLQPNLARTLGALIGANLAVTLTAIVSNTVHWSSAAQQFWTLPSLVVAAAWSAAVCVAKARQGSERVHRPHSVLVVATDGLVGAAVVLAGILIAEAGAPPYWRVAALVLAVVGLAAWTLLARRHRELPAGDWAEVERAPRCLRCGYNLTGLTTPRCPECGVPFEADVVQRLARIPGFPITFWHPLSTSPIGGAVAGACLLFLAYMIRLLLDS